MQNKETPDMKQENVFCNCVMPVIWCSVCATSLPPVLAQRPHDNNGHGIKMLVTQCFLLGVRELTTMMMVCVPFRFIFQGHARTRLLWLQLERSQLLVWWYRQRQLWKKRSLPHRFRTWDEECEKSVWWLGRHVEFFVVVYGQDERNLIR